MRIRMRLLILPVLVVCTLLLQNSYGATKGMIKVVTDPGDAKIYVNGKRKGNSPAEKGQTFALKLPEGEYVVEASKPVGDGFNEYYGEKEIFVAEDSLQTVSLKLKKTRPVKQAKAAFLKKYPNGAIEPEMVEIPGGSFEMGSKSGDSDEKPVHTVTLNSFMMARYEVTFEEWDACVNFGGCSHTPDDEGWGRGKQPVMNVSWQDTQEYIKWLNKQTGKQYRLPTEAEWEYACRSGGKNEKYCGGNSLDQLAWYDKNSGDQTHPVGQKKSNGLGLYDMSGNVWEWVQDKYGKKYYAESAGNNPGGPSSGSGRVERGGGWYGSAGYCRSAYRNYYSPGDRYYNLGFRLLRTP